MDEVTAASEIYGIILQHFPEAEPLFDEDERHLGYLSMSNLVRWLKSVPNCHLDPDIVNRLRAFDDWVCEQPRGTDSGNDILTIYIVGFIETLFSNAETIDLIPKLLSYDDLLYGRDYWIAWVGVSNYESALLLFSENRGKE